MKTRLLPLIKEVISLSHLKDMGLGCNTIPRMDSVPAAFSDGCMMLRTLIATDMTVNSLVALFSWSVFFGGLGFLEVYSRPPFVLTYMQHV